MYHHFVARKVRSAFTQISSGDWQPMVDAMADTFTYRFYGESSLSGERHTHDALRRWWQRSTSLIPHPHFDIQEVIIAGGPSRTRIATRVRVRAQLADGSNYDNTFMQTMRMSWGRITEIYTLEDTAELQQALDRLAARGITDAHAAPIADVESPSP